jgi:methylase of polypeptide subunit release factors
MPVDPSIRDHKAWIGYLQPDGLVVSPAALVDAQVVLDRAAAPLQQQFLGFVEEITQGDNKIPAVASLKRLLRDFLEWPDDCLFGLAEDQPIPESLKIPLREFGETLEPTIAFKQPRPENPERPWLLLVQQVPAGADLDAPVESKLAGWAASASRRFERLLREAEVPTGLLSNATHLRLIYAPRGENSGTLTFPVAAMTEVAGRPILAAFHLLLSRYRLLAAPSEARLPALLKRSRDYQARVSTALAGQVLDALYELLRGFQAADDETHGELLKVVLASDPDQVYSGLLSVLMRLVFLLYAEDQGLMPGSDLYVRNYAVHGLFERLRADADQYPDTMEHRYGAWAQLVALFRVVHRGCQHALLKMPVREGHLFDPDRYPFLEGRSGGSQPVAGQPLKLPLVPDGTIYRILEKLLVLEGERLSYRTLDVEQIGSVYETMMGFCLKRTEGATIALKPAKAHGAPVPVNLEGLLATEAAGRPKYITDRTDYKLTATMATAVKAAQSNDDVLAALERRIARNATPQPVIAGKMVLMPTDERRKSGSHYTPRPLTEPIVRTTLAPVLKQLGDQPTPDQILSLKVCDPAMGSGAFLVEACRQLADALVLAWATHGYKPYIPLDEDEILHARRLIAQRCLYGVDRNPMAVDLAKLSLWLATLAKDHPFTFLDHSLRAGDSLVGLSRRQIVGFDLEPSAQVGFVEAKVRDRMNAATAVRRAILEAGDDMLPGMKHQKLRSADESLDLVRLAGDAVVASFFTSSRAREQSEKRDELFHLLDLWLQHGDSDARGKLGEAVRQLREGNSDQLPVTPFHWEIEYPEVFGRETVGFDVMVGNPPFAGKNTLINGNREGYLDWLKQLHEESHGNADLVAHFFRRAFNLLRPKGCLGLIATNTIGQGDTRSTGLRWIRQHAGTIYHARRRYKWPGQAAVIVSVVHVMNGDHDGPFILDSRVVAHITAYLFHTGPDGDPAQLEQNSQKAFIGAYVLGMGFTFDDTDTSGVANPISLMHHLLEEDPSNAECVFPYIGGQEVNDSPIHAHHRFVINFFDYPLSRRECAALWVTADDRQRATWLRSGVVPLDYPEPVAADWPDLLEVVERKVKGTRASHSTAPWWQYERPRVDLPRAIRDLDRVLVISQTGNALGFAFKETRNVFSHTLVVFAFSRFCSFAVLQSRIHWTWTLAFTATMKDDTRYIPGDCFGTFPFPEGHEANVHLEDVGRTYYEYRAALMIHNDEGLTTTYNRFHDPNETSSDILRLRELHDAMDRAVFDAYGWDDVRPKCNFLLDYEDEDEEEDEGGRIRTRRKPWRYRWPDDVRDDVLARLLKLNAERAEEERRSGATAAGEKTGTSNPGKRTTKRRRKPSAAQQSLSNTEPK